MAIITFDDIDSNNQKKFTPQQIAEFQAALNNVSKKGNVAVDSLLAQKFLGRGREVAISVRSNPTMISSVIIGKDDSLVITPDNIDKVTEVIREAGKAASSKSGKEATEATIGSLNANLPSVAAKPNITAR